MSFHRKAELIRKGIGLVYYKVFQQFVWKFRYNRGGNTFKCSGRLINCSFDIEGKNHRIEIEEGVKLHNVRVTISGSGHHVRIGAGTVWAEWGWIRVEDENNSVLISEQCDFRGCFLTCGDKNTEIRIGRDCLFSAGVVIRSSDSHSILNEQGERINPGRSVDIGQHVWIGNGGLVLKGCKIGENSVVGSNAVVSGKSFPEGSVIVGNPGKVVQTGVNWCKPRI